MRWMRSKSSGERKRYAIDWSSWLDLGESVAAVSFSVLNNSTDTPLVVDEDMILPTLLGVQYYVSGGEVGKQYEVIATMTTNQGQIWQGAVFFAIREL